MHQRYQPHFRMEPFVGHPSPDASGPRRIEEAGALPAKTHLHQLIEQRERLVADMEATRNKIAGLDIAIELLRDPESGNGAASGPRAKVTELLMDLLGEAGPAGLNARTATELAAKRGLPLNRRSVSSLLSRLKKDGTIVYEDHVYKLQHLSRGFTEAATDDTPDERLADVVEEEEDGDDATA